jgi:hypothetical protein
MRRPPERRSRYDAVATVISCIPDAMYPWDPVVVKAIHEFDRNVIPVWVTKVYRAPDTGGFRKIGLHAIASHVPAINRHGPPQEIVYKALMPTLGGPRERPTQLDLYNANRGVGLFGWEYIPFDWRIYRLLRSMYDEWSWKQRREYIDEFGPEAQQRKARKEAQDEADYAAATDAAWLKRQVDQFDDDDMKRVAAGGAPHVAKPFVEVHAKERTS